MKETKHWKLKKKFVKSLWSKEKIKNLFVNLGNEIPKTINYKLQAVKKSRADTTNSSSLIGIGVIGAMSN